MKNITLSLALIMFSGLLTSQTFLKSLEPGGVVDLRNNSNYNPGYSVFINFGNRVHNYASQVLSSYLNMYETTQDWAYLDKFIEQAKEVMDRRNYELHLNLANDPNFHTGLGTLSLPQSNARAWPTRIDANSPWGLEVVTNGIISKPLAQFAYMIKVKYPTLSSRLVPTSVAGMDITGGYNIATYGDFAEMVKLKVDQTVRGVFDQLWDHGQMCYLNSFGNSDNAIPNVMTSIGRTHIYMYKIYEAEGNTSIKDYYLHKIRRIAQRMLNPTETNFHRDVMNHVVYWNYGDPGNQSEREDLSHAILVMEFGDLCNRFNILDENGIPLFDDGLMYDFANTFKTKFITTPLKYSLSITGVDLDQKQIGHDPHQPSFQPYEEGDNERFEQYMNAGRYLFLARYIPDIYNMIADYYYEFSLYGPGTYPVYCESSVSQTYGVESVSQLSFGRKGYTPNFINYLDISSVKRDTAYQSDSDLIGTERWLGVASGKFDPTKATNSAVTFEAFTGKIQIREFDAQKRISNEVASWVPLTGAPKPIWSKVTSGEIIPGNNCDEIVAYNMLDKSIYVFVQNGSSVQLQTVYSTSKNCAGIAAGNITNAQGEELVFLSKDDGRLYVYKYLSSTNTFAPEVISNSALSAFVLSNPEGVVVGNLDNNSANGLEIATINNNNGTDYNIKVFNINPSTLTFNTTVYQYTGTTGNYSNWDGLTIGDFNGDSFDELIIHRHFDGDFYIFYMEDGQIKSLCKENFPVNWSLGKFTPVKFSGENKEHLLSLRNVDGHMFLFQAMDLPSIIRPLDPRPDPRKAVLDSGSSITNQHGGLNEVRIYPNPSAGKFNLSISSAHPTLITLTNIVGDKLFELTLESTQKIQEIDLSDYPAGVYYVRLLSGGEQLTERLIKR